MSRIEDLIAEHCPDGVKFFHVGDIASVGTGSSDRKDATADGEFPFYVRSKEVLRIGDCEFDEEAIVIPGEGGIGEIFHYVSGKYALHQRAYRISFNHVQIDTKFAYYYFAVHFKSFILSKAVSATVTSIRKPMITDFRVPVPPLEVQREIVKVLDTFTELGAELEAELEARQRQYVYYRDALLTLDERIGTDTSKQASVTTLGEIGSFMRGTGVQKADFTETGVGCIHYGQVHTHYGTWAKETKAFVSPRLAMRLRKAQTGDLVIATTSEDDEAVAKAVAWLGDHDVVVSTDAYIFRHRLNPKYVSYFFQTKSFQTQKKPHITGTKVRRISGDSLAKIRIPVPSAEEQERIVSILDKFETLVNDLTSGLPAEILARRQQYEHYRDRLLTFREAA